MRSLDAFYANFANQHEFGDRRDAYPTHFYVKELDVFLTRPATINVASKGDFTRGAAKVIVSDYRYFLGRKGTQKPQIIRGICGFLTASDMYFRYYLIRTPQSTIRI